MAPCDGGDWGRDVLLAVAAGEWAIAPGKTYLRRGWLQSIAVSLSNIMLTEAGKLMDIIWDGVIQADALNEDAANARIRLADAAKSGDWPTVLGILTANNEFINSCRPGGKSLYSPLHQAAYGGASAGIVGQLIKLGAWSASKCTRGTPS